MTNAQQEKGMKVDSDLANDPDYIAYQTALQNSELKDLPPGIWVAFCDGKLFTTNMERDVLLQELQIQKKGGFFHQLGVPEEIDDIPALLLD